MTDEDWKRLTNQTTEYNRQVVAGGTIFSGRVSESQISLAAVGRRIDLVQSIAPSDNPGLGFQSVGIWQEESERFLGFVMPWIRATEYSVTRVAFGAVLLAKTRSVSESYELLKALLKSVSVDPVRMTDLFYRVNWKRKSRVVPELDVNRITSWAALIAHIAQIEAGGLITSSSSETHAVRLEVDNSTDQARLEPLLQLQVIDLINELVAAASEAAENGECS